MPGTSSEREIKYWLTRNTPRASCWIVYTEIEHMSGHPDVKINRLLRDTDTRFDGTVTMIPRDQLSYVYTAHMTPKELITILETKSGLFYLIHNKKVPLDYKEEENVQDQDEDIEDGVENAGEKGEKGEKGEIVGTEVKVEDFVGLIKESHSSSDSDVSKLAPSLNPERKERKEAKDANADKKPVKLGKDGKPIKEEVPTKTVAFMIVADNLANLINNINATIRKTIGLVKTNKMVITKEDKTRLQRLTGFDFSAAKSEDELLAMFRKHLQEIKDLSKLKDVPTDVQEQKRDNKPGEKDSKSLVTADKSAILDFSGNMSIYPAVLEKLSYEETAHIEEIVFFQNIRIGKWVWLSRFKNLKTLSFWYLYQLKDEDFNTICRAAPNLEAINIHECYQISNRVFVPIGSVLKRIERLALDNKVLICQKNAYQGVITEKEWLSIRCDSLKYLLINSDNLTQDTIDSYLKACINIKRFIMNVLVLKRLRKDAEEGLGPNTITFQAAEDLRLGFTIKKDIRINNLLKDRYEPAYSPSMLSIIKKSIIEEAMSNREEGDMSGPVDKDAVDKLFNTDG